MSRQVTIFSGYSQSENRTTNYCLLVLRMLYEENPKFLGQVFTALVGEDLGESIGVQFRQQERRAGSIPDGLVFQPAFSVYIETKNLDWFHHDQLEQHLANLHRETPGLKVLIALSNFEADRPERFASVRELCSQRYKGSLAFAQVSFEDLVEALRIEELPKNVADAVADFRAYLDEENLLPSWRRLLDVVNCAGIPDDVLSGGVYMCPAVGGPYNHRRCMYFGMYRNKRVERVSRIEAVVDIRDPGDTSVKWCNTSLEQEPELLERALRVHAERRAGDYPTRVFLLGPLMETDFRKDTPGGMQASKQYFDIAALGARDETELAARLRGKTWTEMRAHAAG